MRFIRQGRAAVSTAGYPTPPTTVLTLWLLFLLNFCRDMTNSSETECKRRETVSWALCPTAKTEDYPPRLPIATVALAGFTTQTILTHNLASTCQVRSPPPCSHRLYLGLNRCGFCFLWHICFCGIYRLLRRHSLSRYAPSSSICTITQSILPRTLSLIDCFRAWVWYLPRIDGGLLV